MKCREQCSPLGIERDINHGDGDITVVMLYQSSLSHA
jgi:hypothetical protein